MRTARGASVNAAAWSLSTHSAVVGCEGGGANSGVWVGTLVTGGMYATMLQYLVPHPVQLMYP